MISININQIPKFASMVWSVISVMPTGSLIGQSWTARIHLNGRSRRRLAAPLTFATPPTRTQQDDDGGKQVMSLRERLLVSV